jgi:hypothetical protein
MVGKGLQYTGISEGGGRALVEGAEERAPGWTPDMRGRGLLGEALVTGARAVGPMAPAIAASFVPGGQFVAPTVAAGLFGTSSAQETYEKLKGQGVSEEDAVAAARRVGLVQGPLEGVATAVGLNAFRAAKPLVGLGGTTAGVASRMTDTSVLKPFARGMGINLAVQPSTEVAQDVGAEMIERSYGAAPEDIGDIARSSALGGVGLTLLLGPFALGGQVARARRTEALKEALYGQDTPTEVRAKAIDLVMAEAKRQGIAGSDVEQWFDQQLTMEDARNAELAKLESEQEAGEKNLLVTEEAPLQERIDRNLGLQRTERKGYEDQFKAAFDEPSGQFVSDSETGIERELTAGEVLRRSTGETDLTAPAAATAAGETKPTVPSIFSELDTTLNKLGIKPTKNSRGIYEYMVAEGIDPASPEAEPVLNALASSKLGEARKAVGEIIRARSPRGTGVSTVQQPAGGLGVGSPVVQGAVGDAGPAAPVAGTVVGGAPAAGAPLQQAGVLPVAPGQPSTAVTTTAPAAAPAPETRFRRAPRPMTVLEAANAAKAAQAQQAETQGQETPAAAGPVVDPRQATLQQIFGQRNGDIIFDVVGMGMPEPEAATKYGLSRQAIQKIAGATGQKTWPERIARAKTEFGLTDAKIAEAFNVAPQEELGTEVEREVFGRGEAAGAITEAEAIEGGLENIVKTAGAGTAEVEGFSKLDKEIDATLEALAAETDEKVIAELMAKMADLTEKAKAVGKRKQSEVRRDAGKVIAEGETDAVQVESPTGVSVQPKAETGKGVGGQVRRAKKPAAEGKAQVPAQAPAKILTEAKQAAQAWDVVAADFPQAPKFADLTKAQQENFIGFGEGNWERGDVELELTKLARAAAPTQRAITREPVTIDVEARVVEETIAPQVAKLPAPQVVRLENHYGVKRDTPEFLAKVKADVVLFATKGAEAVAGAIRDVIKAIHAGVLSAAMIFNPVQVSQIEAFVMVPQETRTTTQDVLAELPLNVKGMSEAGKQAYATLIPALKDKVGDKLITIADKPSGNIYVFKPDGSLVIQKKSLFGLAKGDLYKGNQDNPKNRITPAGLFNLKVIDAKAGAAENRTAGEYDTGTVLVIDDPDAWITIMHSVWLKEKDGSARAAALKTEGAADSRYSFGCINVDKATYKNLMDNYAAQMDGSKLFVVPDNQADTKAFVTGQAGGDVLVREGVQPATKTTTTPVQSATKTAGVDRTIAAREERAPAPTPARAQELFTRMSRRSVRTTDQDGVAFESVEASLDDLSGYSDGIAAGVRGLRNSGMGNAVDAIDSWMVTFSPVSWDAIYTIVGGKRTIIYNGLILKDKELSTIATLHEVGHGIDEVQGGLGKFSGDREFKMSKVNGEPMAMRPGTVADEVLTYFEDNSDTTALGYMLNYPLDMSDKLNRSLSAQEIREEVFAQVWAFSNMNGGMDFLRANLPTTHAFMEKVHEQVKATKYAAAQGAQQGAQSGQVQAGQQGAQPTGAVSRAARQRQGLIDRDQRFEGLPDAKDPTIDGPTPKGATNIDRAIRLMERAAKAKDPEIAAQLKAEADKLLAGAARGLASGDGRIKFSRASRQRQGLIDRNIAKLPKMAQQPVRNTVGALGDLGGRYLDYAVFTSDLVKRGVAAGMPSAQKFADVLARRAARVSELEREIEKIADGYANIEQEFKGSGRGSVNDFLFESTRTGKWGYGKYRDAKMGAAFDKLGPKAQKFVKDVFAHGDKMLSDKKKIVLDAATSEYDAMIKAAQDANDTKAEASLKAEKAASLKRFQTLFRIREGLPYAPIKRNGTQVVIGKSDEYKAAVAAKDTKRVKQLESDPDHYHVSFVDSKWEARTLKDKLEEQGVFTELDIVTRSQAFEEAFSGEALLPALTKMRAAVDKRATDTNGKKDPTAGKMLSIINQLYLEALAEGSARKSEMRRRGVAGEVDMLQSFTQQGRADANFMANVQFEPLVQDQLQNMRNESRSGDRERKSEIFNELTQRYAGSLDVKVNSWVNGLTNMASKFFLASSPAYYLQNLTQPFMMSLPAMAGRHDYTKAAAELTKAYAELGPLFKDVKLFDQQFDFSKVPADVRTAINELVNQGKIDIGLATEINEYKVDADGKLSQFAQRLNKGMRMAVQKVEAVNRLSTAIAAYRLEFERAKKDPKIADPKAAATQYAADILTDTHGDYTAFNAPRAFNTQWGKVALQFRKFQLIQVAFFYKLFRDAFTNPAERAAAIKSLTYALGHTAVFAGMMGIPGYAAISAILSAFGDEDEPFDLTAWSREQLGPEWADMIMRGAPTVVGMDLSGKIGAGNMLSIMPFSNADLSTTAGRAEAFGTLMGGAALGMASRMADGLVLMSNGDYYKGLERVMPKGVSDALKAGRQATEGMTRRNGDVVLPESEIGAISSVLTGLGVPSVQQAVTYERQNRMRDITQNFQDRTTRIKNDYAKAVRQKDTAAMAEARTAWTKLQQARQRNGLTPQPVSSLLKAPQEQAQREKRTVGGVSYREGQRKLAEDVAAN